MGLKKAIKYDEDKPPMDLLPSLALEEVAHVFGFGAKKYAPYNWVNGFNWSRLIAANMRHMNKFNAGEDKDTDTKRSHIASAIASLLMLLEHELRDLGKDDRRFKQKKGKKNVKSNKT